MHDLLLAEDLDGDERFGVEADKEIGIAALSHDLGIHQDRVGVDAVLAELVHCEIGCQLTHGDAQHLVGAQRALALEIHDLVHDRRRQCLVIEEIRLGHALADAVRTRHQDTHSRSSAPVGQQLLDHVDDEKEEVRRLVLLDACRD